MKQDVKRAAYGAVLILISLIVTSCATYSGDFCDLYRPVKTLDEQIQPQARQVDENNAIYMEMCL